MEIAIIIALILLNGVFAMSEIALISARKSSLSNDIRHGSSTARIALKLANDPDKFLSTIQIGITLIGILTGIYSGDVLATDFGNILTDAGVPATYAYLLAQTLIVILVTYLTIIFGELVPKRIAMHNPEKVSLAVAPIVRFVFTIAKPLVALLSVSTNAILKLIHISPEDQPEQVTEEEIRMMVDVGNEEGSIEKDEADMIDNIFEFDDITVEDVMTHRTDVAAVENTATVMDVIRLAIDEGFSRIPVYREDIDDIIGIVYAKDMLRCINETPDEMSQQPITSFIRPAIFVPESNRCSDLFKTFKEKKTQMAIVVDEYGGTSGVVTMEDLLESIVGNMEDEYDQEEEEYQKVSDNIFILDGSMSIEDVEELLGCNIGPEEDYDTLSGLITDKLDRIPAKDEHPVVRINNVEFTVLDTEERRIAKLRADILPEEPKPEEPDEE